MAQTGSSSLTSESASFEVVTKPNDALAWFPPAFGLDDLTKKDVEDAGEGDPRRSPLFERQFTKLGATFSTLNEAQSSNSPPRCEEPSQGGAHPSRRVEEAPGPEAPPGCPDRRRPIRLPGPNEVDGWRAPAVKLTVGGGQVARARRERHLQLVEFQGPEQAPVEVRLEGLAAVLLLAAAGHGEERVAVGGPGPGGAAGRPRGRPLPGMPMSSSTSSGR